MILHGLLSFYFAINFPSLLQFDIRVYLGKSNNVLLSCFEVVWVLSHTHLEVIWTISNRSNLFRVHRKFKKGLPWELPAWWVFVSPHSLFRQLRWGNFPSLDLFTRNTSTTEAEIHFSSFTQTQRPASVRRIIVPYN